MGGNITDVEGKKKKVISHSTIAVPGSTTNLKQSEGKKKRRGGTQNKMSNGQAVIAQRGAGVDVVGRLAI